MRLLEALGKTQTLSMAYLRVCRRSWDKLYCVLRGSKLMFYKDSKTSRATPEIFYRGEPPIDVLGGQASVAEDYTKKKHVLRLK